MRDCLGYKRTQNAGKTTLVTIYSVHGGNFSWEVNFADFGFLRFGGKKNRVFGFLTLLVRTTFRRFHVEYLKVTKREAILFATNFIEV